MRVTVLIPSWNSASYIGRALQSIVDSGHADLEILVMDNLSTDGTADVVQKFADKRVQYHSQQDGGIYEALNRGIALSTGEIVCWVGADDQHDRDALKKVVAGFADPGVQWLVGDGTFLYEGDGRSEKKYHRLPDRVDFGRLVMGNPLISPSVFFRADFFRKAGGFDQQYKYAADYDLWLRFARLAVPAVAHQSLSIFSYNGGNISSKSKIKMYRETLQILYGTRQKEVRWPRLCNIARIRVYSAYNRLKQIIPQ